MTEQYAPSTEEVRELIAEAREFDRHPCDPQENYLIHRLADALETMYVMYLQESATVSVLTGQLDEALYKEGHVG